jgi:hypothetical protein
MARESTQQQQSAGEGDNITGARSAGSQPQTANTDRPQVGTRGEAATENGGTEPGANEDNGAAGGRDAANRSRDVPDGPRTSSLTGAVDAGSIGSNLEFNRARGLSPFDVGYRVIEEDSKLQPYTPADHRLMEVYGDTIHMNDGTHLDGGIGVANDLIWQRRWLKVVSVDLKLWYPPTKHADGKRFVNLLANEFQGVRLRKWNSERAMIFAPAILHRKHGVAKASQITKLIGHRLDLWEAGRYAELVNEVVITGGSGVAGRNPAEWGEKEVSDSVAKTYNNMVLDGKIRGAVRFATSR